MATYMKEETKEILKNSYKRMAVLTDCLKKAYMEEMSLTEVANKMQLTPQRLNNIIRDNFKPFIKQTFKDAETIDALLKSIEPSSCRLLRAVLGFKDTLIDLPHYDEDKLYDDIMPKYLTQRELMVLSMHFGTPDNPNTMTLDEIGQSLYVTRERVRQIEAKALRKLRRPYIIKEIFDMPKDLTFENRIKDDLKNNYEKTMQRYIKMQNYISQIEEMEEKYNINPPSENPSIRINSLQLSIRAYNCLNRAGITTLEQLAAMPDEKIKAIRSLGQRSYEEIIQVLENYGYRNPQIGLDRISIEMEQEQER